MGSGRTGKGSMGTERTGSTGRIGGEGTVSSSARARETPSNSSSINPCSHSFFPSPPSSFLSLLSLPFSTPLAASSSTFLTPLIPRSSSLPLHCAPTPASFSLCRSFRRFLLAPRDHLSSYPAPKPRSAASTQEAQHGVRGIDSMRGCEWSGGDERAAGEVERRGGEGERRGGEGRGMVDRSGDLRIL